MIFDTDVLIWASRGDDQAEALVSAQTDRQASIVTMIELLEGAKSKAELLMIRRLFVDLEIELVPLSETIGYDAANLIEEHCLADGLRLEDALIAATARETAQVLATANVKHFRSIPRLELKPFRPQRH